MHKRYTIVVAAALAACDAPDGLWPCGFGPCADTDGAMEEQPVLPFIEWTDAGPCAILAQLDAGYVCAEAHYSSPGTFELPAGPIATASYGPTGIFGLPEWTLPPSGDLVWVDSALKDALLDGLRLDMVRVEALAEPSVTTATWVLADEWKGCPVMEDGAIVSSSIDMQPVARVAPDVILCVGVPYVPVPIEFHEDWEEWGDWGSAFVEGRILGLSMKVSEPDASEVDTLDLPVPRPVYSYSTGRGVYAYAGYVGVREVEGLDDGS